jgi:transcriptional regulator with XRE-family HTH domain
MRRVLTSEQEQAARRLCQRLRDARRAAQIPIGVLAANSGLAVDTVKRIEAATALSPTCQTVAAIARTLGMSLDELDRHSRGDEP